MNSVDLVIALVLLLSLITGWRRGFLAELGSLAVIFLMPWALASFSRTALDFWSLFIPSLPLAWVVALMSLVLILLLLGKLLGTILQKILPRFLLPLNSLGGVILSLAKTLLWLGLLASVLGRLPMINQTSLWQEAILTEPLSFLGDCIFLGLGKLLCQPQPEFTSPGELI